MHPRETHDIPSHEWKDQEWITMRLRESDQLLHHFLHLSFREASAPDFIGTNMFYFLVQVGKLRKVEV